MRALRTCVVATLSTLGALGIASASGLDRPEVSLAPVVSAETLNVEGAPVRLQPVPATPRPRNVPSHNFRLEIAIENRSNAPIERLDLQAFVFSATGAPKGFHAFTLRATYQPWVTAYTLYSTSGYSLEAGDRLVVFPYAAYGKSRAWSADPETIHRLAGSFGRRGDPSELEAIWSAENNPPQPGLGEPRDRCQSECATAQSNCSTQCPCGVSNFTCSCTNEGLSIGCGCFQCPAPRPGG